MADSSDMRVPCETKPTTQEWGGIKHEIYLNGVGAARFGPGCDLRLTGTGDKTIRMVLIDSCGNHVARQEFTADELIELLVLQ